MCYRVQLTNTIILVLKIIVLPAQGDSHSHVANAPNLLPLLLIVVRFDFNCLNALQNIVLINRQDSLFDALIRWI